MRQALVVLIISASFVRSELFYNPLCGVHREHCQKTNYRSWDGSCNNLRHPHWGTTNSVYGRMLPAYYEDGFSKPVETSVRGGPRPLSRDVSMKLFPDKFVEDPNLTLGFMQFSQFIAHDLSLGLDTESIGTCCSGDKNRHCYPIKIPQYDIQYITANVTCMSFLRTGTDYDLGCYGGSGPVWPINSVNNYLDLSQVYGNSENTADSLRSFSLGKLFLEERYHQQWLPNAGNKCFKQTEPCYRAGDVRVNQNAELTVLQTLWAREHNRICERLALLNPHWNDEKLYQEARRINIAQFQHIVYAEYLPILLGEETVHNNNITYKEDCFVDDYDDEISPIITLEFAVGAFRYFHSAIAGKLQLINERREIVNTTRLSTWINRPTILESEDGDGIDYLARGLTTQKQLLIDPFIDSEFSQYFLRGDNIFGVDIQAFQVHRDRDNGLRSYNDYRPLFGFPKADTFDDLSDTVAPRLLNLLKELYDDVNDVEFSTGSFSEPHVGGSLAGPTYRHVLVDQFKRLRIGDRLFYQRQECGLTLEQLRAVRKASFSRIICDNGNSITHMQPSGFNLVSDKNPVKTCIDLPYVDLNLWQETQPTTKNSGCESGTETSTSHETEQTRSTKRPRPCKHQHDNCRNNHKYHHLKCPFGF